jgi:hypothetical protein
MSWRDPKWIYNNAATTAKPGYLQERFKQIREDLAVAKSKRADLTYKAGGGNVSRLQGARKA